LPDHGSLGGLLKLISGRSHDEQSCGSSGESSAAEEPGQGLPPRSATARNFGWRFDEAFCFELCAQGNPHPSRGLSFRREQVRGRDDIGEICYEILAAIAIRQMGFGSFRQWSQTFPFKNDFYIPALHDESPRGWKLWQSLPLNYTESFDTT
jgi:hypothetical protein